MNLSNYILYRYCVHGIIDSSVVQQMTKYTQHSDVSTFEHCMLVSYLSYSFCRFMGWNYYAAARGGLLHDLFLYDWHDVEISIKTPKDAFRLHGFSHATVALDNAYENFELSLIEMDIIKKHMWPLTPSLPMYKESYVVSVMDKVAAMIEIFRLNRINAINRIIKMESTREYIISELFTEQ